MSFSFLVYRQRVAFRVLHTCFLNEFEKKHGNTWNRAKRDLATIDANVIFTAYAIVYVSNAVIMHCLISVAS